MCTELDAIQSRLCEHASGFAYTVNFMILYCCELLLRLLRGIVNTSGFADAVESLWVRGVVALDQLRL